MSTLAQPPVYRQFFIDNDENKLLIRSTDKTIAVFLQLKAEGTRKRRIGIVTKSTGVMDIKRIRTEHLFRKGNAYGFNEYVLRYQTSFTHVRLFDTVDYWKIPVQFILDNGTYLDFKKEGLEKQIFVSLQQIEQFKVLVSENRRL